MSDIAFTLPGKLGDNICRLPIAYQYAIQYNKSVDLILDLNSSNCLESVLSKQSWVDNIKFSPGIENYDLGGQPWDFGYYGIELKNNYKELYHLGYRGCPDKNYTKYALNSVPIKIEELLTTSCIENINIEDKPKKLVISGESSRGFADMALRQTLGGLSKYLKSKFDEIIILTINPLDTDTNIFYKYIFKDQLSFFNDNGDLNKTVDLLSKSQLITTYSAMSALAYIIKSNQIVIKSGINLLALSHFNVDSYYGKDFYINEYDIIGIKNIIK